MQILSVQSWVSFGHVGNAAAMFPLQRLGFEVGAIHTVQFSNHTGYGAWRGQVYAPETILELVAGMQERDAFVDLQAVLSGYMGGVATIDAVCETVRRVRATNPNVLYCCDPVMGDVGRGVFVHKDIPAHMPKAVALADVLTPNQFELELLTGRRVASEADALQAAKNLQAHMHPHGPRLVVVTSLQTSSTPTGSIETLCLTQDGAWRVRTPLLQFAVPPNGTGDTISALFLGHFLRTRNAQQSLGLAVSGLYALLQITKAAGTREIALVAAQNEYLQPTQLFEAEALLV